MKNGLVIGRTAMACSCNRTYEIV